MATNQPQSGELVACKACGSECSEQVFGPSPHLEKPVSLWMCSNHRMLGGNCPVDRAWFGPDVWNSDNSPTASKPIPAEVGELVERLEAQADDLDTYGLDRKGLKHIIAIEREAAALITRLASQQVPGEEGWLVAELQGGIIALKEEAQKAEEQPHSHDRTFWLRYWAGYLAAYEGLLAKLGNRPVDVSTPPSHDQQPGLCSTDDREGELVSAMAKAHHDYRRGHYRPGHPSWEQIDWATREQWRKSMQAALTVLDLPGMMKAERERCAKVAEGRIAEATDWDSSYWDQAAANIAQAIRNLEPSQ